ncbi:hypothetical protein D3C76_699710 [compost metagenome]
MAVIQRIDHGHGAWQRPFYRLPGLLTQKLGIFDKYRLLPGHSTHHCGDACIITITDPDRLAFLEIDAAQVLDEGRHKVLARLFTITDDINTGVLLLLQCQAQGILLAFNQCLILQFPG